MTADSETPVIAFRNTHFAGKGGSLCKLQNAKAFIGMLGNVMFLCRTNSVYAACLAYGL